MAYLHKIRQLLKCKQNFSSSCNSSLGKIILKNNSGNFVPNEIYDKYQQIFFKPPKPIKKITTWNVQELWWHWRGYSKIDNIISYISQCDSDVICLQEVFEPRSLWKLTNHHAILNKYPHFLTGNMYNQFLVGENSGMVVLSKQPILFRQFTPFLKSRFPDSYAAKGGLYFSIGTQNFITTHLQSGSIKLAGQQLTQLLENSPFKSKAILLGDLNMPDPFSQMDCSPNNIIHTHDSGRILDHIVSIHKDIPLDITVDHIDINNVSDHYPVHAIIKRNYPTLGSTRQHSAALGSTRQR